MGLSEGFYEAHKSAADMLSKMDIQYQVCRHASRMGTERGKEWWLSTYLQLSCVAYPAYAALLDKAEEIPTLARKIRGQDHKFQTGPNDRSVM